MTRRRLRLRRFVLSAALVAAVSVSTSACNGACAVVPGGSGNIICVPNQG